MTKPSLFGELSMLFEGKRSATIKTLEATLVIFIPKIAFDKYMKNTILKKIGVTVEFYKSLPFTKNLDFNTLLVLSSKTHLQVL